MSVADTYINTAPIARDLCPVCCIRSVHPGSIYCGPKCRVLGYNFRKRLAEPIRFLKSIGFRTDYRNGVELYISIPINIQYAYPETVHNFTFPDPCLSLDALSAPALWEHLIFRLGVLVGGMLEWLAEKQPRELQLSQDMLLHAIHEALFQPSHHFVCLSCGSRFVASALSYAEDGECYDCAMKRITQRPF